MMSKLTKKEKKQKELNWLIADLHQVGGDHYLTEIQPWDFIIANNLSFLQGNIIKYICRYNDKGGVEDLYKADHYLKKLIETEEK
jgi:hypothetical protein